MPSFALEIRKDAFMKSQALSLGRLMVSGFVFTISALIPLTQQAGAQTVRVDITAAHAIKFDPDQALGSSMDILPSEHIDQVYSPSLIKEALSAGWGPITYRQNTELTVAAWHWNADGTWSDPEHQR